MGGFVVEYDQHLNAVTISNARKDADEVQLSWATRLNLSYTIEWTEDLGAPWTFLTTVVGNGAVMSLDDFLAGGRRFYRAVAPQ